MFYFEKSKSKNNKGKVDLHRALKTIIRSDEPYDFKQYFLMTYSSPAETNRICITGKTNGPLTIEVGRMDKDGHALFNLRTEFEITLRWESEIDDVIEKIHLHCLNNRTKELSSKIIQAMKGKKRNVFKLESSRKIVAKIFSTNKENILSEKVDYVLTSKVSNLKLRKEECNVIVISVFQKNKRGVTLLGSASVNYVSYESDSYYVNFIRDFLESLDGSFGIELTKE